MTAWQHDTNCKLSPLARVLDAGTEEYGNGEKQKSFAILCDGTDLNSVIAVEAWNNPDQKAMKSLICQKGNVVSLANAKLQSKGKGLGFLGKQVKIAFDTCTVVKPAPAGQVPESLPLVGMKDLKALMTVCAVSMEAVLHVPGSAVERNFDGKKKRVSNVKLACESFLVDAAFWGTHATEIAGATAGQALRLDWVCAKPEGDGLVKLTSTAWTKLTLLDAGRSREMAGQVSDELQNLFPQYSMTREQKLQLPAAQGSIEILHHLLKGSGVEAQSGTVKMSCCYVVDMRGLDSENPDRCYYIGCSQCKKMCTGSCPNHSTAALTEHFALAVTLRDPTGSQEFIMNGDSMKSMFATLGGIREEDVQTTVLSKILAQVGMEQLVARVSFGPKKLGTGFYDDLFDLSKAVNDEGVFGSYQNMSVQLPHMGTGAPPLCCQAVVLDSLGQMCLAVNGAASNKVVALALLMGVLLEDPEADVLHGIDGMSVRAKLRCVACNQTMHWKQEGVIRSVQKLCRARRGETMKAFCISPGDGDSYIAQDVVLVEHEAAQKLFKYEASQVLLSVDGAKDAFDEHRVKSLLSTAKSAKRLKVTKTLDAGDA